MHVRTSLVIYASALYFQRKPSASNNKITPFSIYIALNRISSHLLFEQKNGNILHDKLLLVLVTTDVVISISLIICMILELKYLVLERLFFKIKTGM